MAPPNFLVSTLAFMAILAILQGIIIPVTGRLDIQSPVYVNKDLREGSKPFQASGSTTTQPAVSVDSEADSSQGTWDIFNNLPDPVSIYCHSQTKDVPPSTVQPRASLINHFAVISGWTNQWSCDFRWDDKTGLLAQTFEVWANADSSTPYLSTCNYCTWLIQTDGFYFQGSDGLFVREWQWTPLSTNRDLFSVAS